MKFIEPCSFHTLPFRVEAGIESQQQLRKGPFKILGKLAVTTGEVLERSSFCLRTSCQSGPFSSFQIDTRRTVPDLVKVMSMELSVSSADS
jgi:hypothetical protein